MRPMLWIVLLASLVRGAAAQQPAVVMIEDFEGAPAWSGLTRDTTGAREGNGCGLWIPATNATVRSDRIPHDWSGYDLLSLWLYSERANGQRLTLVCNSDNAADPEGWDYFYYHFEVNWQGWRLLNLRLGEDLRAARKPLGWQQIDYISINASGWQHEPLPDTVLRLDAVRLVRAPAHIEPIGQETRQADGQAVTTIRLRVVNRTDRPHSFPLRVEGAFRIFAPALEAERTPQIEPGEEAVVTVALRAEGAALAGAEPLTREEGRVVVDAGIEGMPPMQAEIAAAAPLPPRARPLLFATAEEIERARQRAERYAWARKSLDTIISRAEAALKLEVAIPAEGGQWDHYYVCRKCGVGLRTQSPTEHQCPRCGTVYSGWPYDQVVVGRQHHRLTRAISDLGLGYAFTGRVEYAQKAREILLGYGQRYASFPLHDVRGRESVSGGRLYAQTLDEAVDIIRVAWGYDLIYDSGVLSAEDRQVIENGYLREVARTIMRHDARESNWQSWHNAGVAAIGFALRDETLAAHAINGAHGLRFQLRASILPDGFWYEGAAAYHFYALDALQWTMEAALRSGINLYDNAAYKAMFDAPLLYVFPNLQFPAVNDSDVFALSAQRRLYEVAYARLGDPTYLKVLTGAERGGTEALLWGAEELPEAPDLELPSRNFAGLGALVLRSGTGQEQSYVHLDYGPHGGGHGHPDKLALILYARGRELAPDPGRLLYAAPLHAEWYRQTIAHNTVTVDGVSQAAAEGRLLLFHDGPVAKIARAECDTAYRGVTMRRTVVLADGYLLDLFELASGTEHQYDWAWHNVGEVAALPAGMVPGVPVGSANGYQHISEVQHLRTDAPWQVRLRVPEAGAVVLTALGEPGTELFVGAGVTGRNVERCPVVIARRRAANTLFVAAISWASGAPAVQALERVSVAAQGDRALGLRVVRDGGEDLLLLAPKTPGVKTIGGLQTAAQLLFVSRADGQVRALEQVDEVP